jgi:hypothetical protein
MRGKVRDMEAFGWMLDDYEDASRGKVKMKFWRSADIPGREKLRKIEYALSRMPGEASILNLKTLIGFLVCLLISSLAWSLLHNIYFVLYTFGISVLFLAWFLDNDGKRLLRRRHMLLERARSLTSARESTERSVEKRLDERK